MLPVFVLLKETLSGVQPIQPTPVRHVSPSLTLNMTNDYMFILAPSMQAFPHSDYDTILNGDTNQPPVAPMTGLQITMSREIGGWPLYTIVIALGQVGISLSMQNDEILSSS